LSAFRSLVALALSVALTAALQAKQPILLPNNPALSPDGATLAFDWNGDVWTVPAAGGVARQLTQHPAHDREPKFSPDGKEIAFVSDREGSSQVFVMPAQGGAPQQLTFHAAGHSLLEWSPDGHGLIVSGARDHFWSHPDRFFRVNRGERMAEQLLFDDYGQGGTLSPDGKRLLFTREGPEWWRKGYHGSRASQVWMYDLEHKSFARVLSHERGCRWPLWRPDGRGFYYVGAQSGSFNLREYDLETSKDKQLTRFEDDSVVFPCISRDGSALVFRHLFDLYRYRPDAQEAPVKIDIFQEGDRPGARKERRLLDRATDVAFSHDGLEIAFIAGGDLWVMDTELREPKRITATAEEERYPVFAPDGESLLFVSDMKGQCDIWKAERTDKQKFWWQNDHFKLERLTNDSEIKSSLKWSPDGSRVAFVKGRGDLCVMEPNGQNPKTVAAGWSRPEFDWSPDGKWLVYAQDDNDFNRDVWLLPLDGSRPPFNLSRSPNNEHNPVWSHDGKVIAFTGQRENNEVDIFYVWLRAEDAEKSTHDRLLEKALDKMKGRKPGTGDAAPDKPAGPKKPGRAEVVIDFDGIHDRIHRVQIPNSTETNLFWASDGRKLAFTATVDGKLGTYTIDIAENLTPQSLTSATGTHARWLKQGNQVVWLSGGVPASLPVGGGTVRSDAPTTGRSPFGGPGRRTTPPPSSDTTDSSVGGTAYRFQVRQEVDLEKRNVAVFDLCWREIRDNYYDERLGNRNWDGIRKKYQAAAAAAPDAEGLATVINLMLGELNGSHLGFYATGAAGRGRPGPTPTPAPAPGTEPTPTTQAWTDMTPHLGIRFQDDYPGPGLKVRDVLPGSPAEHKKSRVLPGEIVVSIDGKELMPTTDLTSILNGPLARDIVLKVKNAEGKEREVTLRPIAYQSVRALLYEKWVADNRKLVDRASGGKLGYLHINAMSMPSFYRFEEELYSEGFGKDGLVIDVRENGGGSTTDHLLTALTQPVHAITVGRGGGPGYPQDRKVYATWNKPIVVLCNQNSFSNAEIFSHAIQTLKRGQLVGVPTAGGVISTGGTQIMDAGFLRLPFRGWYLLDNGEDMELNGAVPQHVVWPQPGEMPQGKDAQLAKGVEVLLADVKAWKERPLPPLHKASERGVPPPGGAGARGKE
jgi:tricorn protease